MAAVKIFSSSSAGMESDEAYFLIAFATDFLMKSLWSGKIHTPFADVFQPCRADKNIITELNKNGKEKRTMAENKRIETMLAQTSREEAEELQSFMDTLDIYEKREFMGIIRGARLMKELQMASQAVATA